MPSDTAVLHYNGCTAIFFSGIQYYYYKQHNYVDILYAYLEVYIIIFIIY